MRFFICAVLLLVVALPDGDECASLDDWVAGEANTETNGERIVIGEPNYYESSGFADCQNYCDNYVGDVTCNGISFVTSNNRCFLFSSATALEATALENRLSSYRPCSSGYVHNGGSRACCTGTDASDYHARCYGFGAISVCKEFCDNDATCNGYVRNTNDSCDFTTTIGSCPSGFSLFNSGNYGPIAHNSGATCGSGYGGCWVKTRTAEPTTTAEPECTGMGSTTKTKFQRYLKKLESLLDNMGKKGSNGKKRKWDEEKLMNYIGLLAFSGEPGTDNEFRTDAKKWFADAYIEYDGTCQDSTYSDEKFDRLKTDVDTFVETLPDCVSEQIFGS